MNTTENRKPLRAVFAAALSLAAVTSLVALAGVGFAKSSVSAAQYEYGPKGKTTICHKGKTITVSNNALKGHKHHGDTIGACPTDKRKGKDDDKGKDDGKKEADKSPVQAPSDDKGKKGDDDKQKAAPKADEKTEDKSKAEEKKADDHGKSDDKGKSEDKGKPDNSGKGKGK